MGGGSGSVIMIYGLTPGRTNCDHVFNLLCSYGNVLKVNKAPVVLCCAFGGIEFGNQCVLFGTWRIVLIPD